RAGLCLAGGYHLPAAFGNALLQRARCLAAGPEAGQFHAGELRGLLPEILLPAADLVVDPARRLDHRVLSAHWLSRRLCAGEARQGAVARGPVPADRAAVLEQRAGPGLLLDYGAAAGRVPGYGAARGLSQR